MKIFAIIQARKNSLRFKNKVLSRLCELTTLEHVIIRTLRCKLVDVTVIATTERKENDEIAQIGKKWGIEVFRGSEEPLTRFFEVARIYRPEHVIRIKADCPALDSEVVDIAITSHLFKNAHYTTNTLQRTYPLGYDVEIFSYKALEWFYLNSLHPVEREHISLKFEKFCPFPVNHLKCRENFFGLRLTIDYKEDYEVMKVLFENLYSETPFFGFKEVKKFFKECPEIFNLNFHISPNAGVLKDFAKCTQNLERE
ncbi:MAG: Spore coat polysaccharide biosynthesis protein SpsF [Thermodesulfobacterium sp.]|uniref:Spore coat polysaccharide biosynthesis protein SpsF n=1 Tax=Candidatus Thermodesulfobacterium syntrophicum TaxID=3060442 RepID=A0AAE3TEI2_9BACT|nr:Spore coat polysaccharide biosynthesis protein SpsF [Candidatus Thermodesulfobacterium syntrophicum]